MAFRPALSKDLGIEEAEDPGLTVAFYTHGRPY